MARKASRSVATSRGKKSSAAKGRKASAAKRPGGAKRAPKSASARRLTVVPAESFLRCIRTLDDLDLVQPFLQSSQTAKLTLTMDAAALERVKESVNRAREAASASAGTDSGGAARSVLASNSPAAKPRGLKGVKPFPPRQGDPFPGPDPFDF